jgi:glycosyltransferase involved in cell wall biosynthesis
VCQCASRSADRFGANRKKFSMRILLLAQFFPPDIGGEERHVFNLANTLRSRGHHVAVGTQCVVGLPDQEVLPSGARVYRFKTLAMRLPGVYAGDRQHHLPFPDPTAVRNLKKILESERPDIVHAHNWIVNSVLPLHRRVDGRPNFGLVLTLHDYSNSCATKRLMRNGQPCSGPTVTRCFGCARKHYGPVVGPVTTAATAVMRPWKERGIDYIVSVSRAVADGNGLIDGPRSSVIPNFVLDTVVQPVTEEPVASKGTRPELPDEDFLLFAGDLSRDKGVPTLLKAYEALGTDRPRLVLVGKRMPETPTNLPKGADVYYGWPHEDILAAFQRCVAAVLPSAWPDPCPTTVLEAMACHRPLITTSTGGMVDMIVDGESGLLVPPGDTVTLAAAMKRLLDDEALRSRLAANARDRVQIFTASVVARQLEAVYERVAPRLTDTEGAGLDLDTTASSGTRRLD